MSRSGLPPALAAFDKLRNLVGGLAVTAAAVAYLVLGNTWGRFLGAVLLVPAVLVGVHIVRKRRRRNL